MLLRVFIATALSGISLGLSNGADAAPSPFEEQARAILTKHCTACHSPDSGEDKAIAEIADILDTRELVKRGHLIPGQPDSSELWKQVRDDNMPDGAKFFSREPVPGPDKAILRNWITSLETSSVVANRDFISDGDILGYIFDDLAKISATRAKEHRYFTPDSSAQ